MEAGSINLIALLTQLLAISFQQIPWGSISSFTQFIDALMTKINQRMKMKLSTLFLLFAIFIFTSSCNRPECSNDNPTFDKFSADTKEYKGELAKQMQSIGRENLSYWFYKYLKKDGQEFIIVYIQGGDLCAKGEIQVNNWSKIIGMRREPSGYQGAELQGLKIEIKRDSTETSFIYKDIDRIID